MFLFFTTDVCLYNHKQQQGDEKREQQYFQAAKENAHHGHVVVIPLSFSKAADAVYDGRNSKRCKK